MAGHKRLTAEYPHAIATSQVFLKLTCVTSNGSLKLQRSGRYSLLCTSAVISHGFVSRILHSRFTGNS